MVLCTRGDNSLHTTSLPACSLLTVSGFTYCYNIFTNGRKNIIEILQQNFNFNCSLEDLVVADDNVLLLDEN